MPLSAFVRNKMWKRNKPACVHACVCLLFVSFVLAGSTICQPPETAYLKIELVYKHVITKTPQSDSRKYGSVEFKYLIMSG